MVQTVSRAWVHTNCLREREKDVGIIGVIIYDDLVLEAWTQRGERERGYRNRC